MVAVAAGGALGTAIRHGLTSTSWRASFVVFGLNVIGSAILGAIVAHRARAGVAGIHDRWSALIGIGFCGGLTTFATHAVDVAQHLDHHRWLDALTSLVATSALCVAAAALGHWGVRYVAGPKR